MPPATKKLKRKIKSPAAILDVKKASCEGLLSALAEALALREKDLDARETQLEEERQELDNDRFASYGATSPSDVINLNVGGVKTSVLRRTLTSVPGSMLASRFSGRWDESIEKDENGHFFIDQEYSLFRHMLDYLRNKANGGVGDEKYPVKSPEMSNKSEFEKENFYRMLEYYGMTNGIYPVVLNNCKGSSDSVEMIGSRKASAKEWTTFLLAPTGHTRRIKTFEVTLGTVQRIQIGWNVWGNDCSLINGSAGVSENNDGIGDMKGTFALDLTRSLFLVEGDNNPVDGLEHPKGTVVRSEDFGKVWYLNGEIIAPISGEKHDALMELQVETDKYGEEINVVTMWPLISVKGDIEITSLELES